ncbi:acetyl-CoA carboxylase carboxyltransferase subunit alpha [Pelotomaculum propionicicum]|mgnify:CR=1 FL=1|uniref:Acetyl-coenzyme A carboxylase carboxyl transferase subunit alpha n=1 Tax=Pelotomaculum propionicicum TaxID=258475 RepID=A0A4Y7RQX9_9FIRM|nr:acetyl-CoA carboxylase carboxyltransferase subunit alpha [Pelotomaculum propionicicum]NLI14198.1 acetyl-CoA carboxylase carboxyltransferase subunit alpha [Peptococcaceae bacterium]TEB11241.1 Acetyl-coenzyme A carboxylase carboxyl transferase subunit alpha [Pelotomaculum propionicicum]
MAAILEFEKPIQELENKISELRTFSKEKGIDLSNEIAILEKRAVEVRELIYSNLTAWQHVLIARHPERPNTSDYINYLFQDFIEMHGDRYYGDDPAVIGGIGRFNGRPVTVIGQLKGKDTKENLARNFGMAHPEGYRKAMRLMKQAEKFNRPVVCFIDTPGAYPGIGAEERGQFEAIARSILIMATLKVPIIAVVIGEGFSGGALGIGVGDRILMQEHSIYSVITPEGYASILWKDSTRNREAAETIRIVARDIQKLGVADKIVPEPVGGAHRDPAAAAGFLGEAIAETMEELLELAPEALLARRYEKYRSIGNLAD